MVGDRRPALSKTLDSISHLMRVDIDGYYGQNSKSIYFLLVIGNPLEAITQEVVDEMSVLGPSFAKDEQDHYVLGGLDDSIKKNHFFWNPQFNVDTLKRLAVASLEKLENFYIKDAVLVPKQNA